MTENEEFKSVRRLALACLGRNVLHFQRVEAQLKRLVLLCDFIVPHGSEEVKLTERMTELRMTTMGNLVNELHQRLYGKPADPVIQDSIAEVVIRVQLRVEAAPDYVAQQKQSLSDLVRERNHLIHQDLAEFDPNAEESCRQWITRLDEQNVRIEAHYRELQKLLDFSNEVARYLFAHIQPDDLSPQAVNLGSPNAQS